MRQHFVLADEGGSSDLRHHKSGVEARTRREKRWQPFAQRWINQAFESAFADAGQRAESNREKVQREGDWLAVKVSPGNDIGLCVFRFRTSDEDQWVIDSGICFDFKNFAAMGQRVADCTMHLRHA